MRNHDMLFVKTDEFINTLQKLYYSVQSLMVHLTLYEILHFNKGIHVFHLFTVYAVVLRIWKSTHLVN